MGGTVKLLNPKRQPPKPISTATGRALSCDNHCTCTPMDEPLTRHRRVNALALFQAHAERALAAGAAPRGLEQEFAATLAISPSMWSQIKSSRPIGDKLARQIERHCGKPKGWLDEVRDSDAPTPAERVFLRLALEAHRATDAAGRRALRAQLKAMVLRKTGG
jgi:hypothetical protein